VTYKISILRTNDNGWEEQKTYAPPSTPGGVLYINVPAERSEKSMRNLFPSNFHSHAISSIPLSLFYLSPLLA